MKFEEYKEIPIPKLKSKEGWEQILIEENREPLINIESLNSSKIRVESIYYKKKLKGSLSSCYAREGLVEKLLKAADYLPDGYSFIVYDAWRPLNTQKAIFDEQMSLMKEENPHLSWDEVLAITNRFVALPEFNEKSPATHITGGAIDLTIENSQGHLLYMGSAFDEFSDASNTYYLESKKKREKLTHQEEEALKNRRVLFHILAEQGFTNFTEEWWHFDYFNQYWAAILKKEKAFYGLVTL